MNDLITIAILAKDKAHTLPIYLTCLLNLDYPKDKILLYVRSNNNNDNTIEILSKWINEYKDLYKEVYFDYSDVSEQISQYKQHDWNPLRFRVLAKIRNDSLNFALSKGTHYFVADCDNFILPITLTNLYHAKVPIVGPLLTSSSNNGNYSNYHEKSDPQGYFANSAGYFDLLHQKITSLVSVDVIHCTYFIRYEYLSKLTYSDQTSRHEYVIFSESARKQNILQFLDTRFNYGRITFAETEEELKNEPWYPMFVPKKLIISPQSSILSNRFLAMASSFAFGDKFGYESYYMWCDTTINLNDFIYDPVKKLKSFPEIDQIFSEWIPGDFWYPLQSGAQKHWNKEVIKIDRVLEQTKIKDSILIETSLQFPFVSQDEISSSFQKYFKPVDFYTSYLNSFPEIDVGVWITRKHINYLPESNQSPEKISIWLQQFSSQRLLVFCDDDMFLSQIEYDTQFETSFLDVPEEKKEFLKFLILSNKCSIIYGTPGDSVCYVAGLFGGKKHNHFILS
jgi:glycosyltransferase involved in cell wall biosynthesis